MHYLIMFFYAIVVCLQRSWFVLVSRFVGPISRMCEMARIFVCVCVCANVRACVRMRACLRACVRARARARVCVSLSARAFVLCVCVCVCVRTHLFTLHCKNENYTKFCTYNVFVIIYIRTRIVCALLVSTHNRM